MALILKNASEVYRSSHQNRPPLGKPTKCQPIDLKFAPVVLLDPVISAQQRNSDYGVPVIYANLWKIDFCSFKVTNAKTTFT